MKRNHPQKASDQKQATSSKPFIIPIFIPHAGCPHQCVFCNQASITGTHSTPTGKDVRYQVENFLSYTHRQRRCVQIAFFGGNFFGVQKRTRDRLLAAATKCVTAGLADSIRFSTRPDTVNRQRLASISDFPVSTIELGVQSMSNAVLKNSRRGHTAADTIRSVQLLKEHDYQVGVQMMVGLPGDTVQRLNTSGSEVLQLKPDFIRIYPTVVVEGSPLAKYYKNGDYVPLSLSEAVRQVKDLYLLFKDENIPVIRMGLQATEDLESGSTILAGPYHPAFGHLVYSGVFLDMAVAAIKKKNLRGSKVTLHVHPRSVSKMRGQKNGNIKILLEKFHLGSLEIIPDESLNRDQLLIHARS